MDKKSDGFTLVELIIMIALLGIIATVTVPKIDEFKSMAEEGVCDANRNTVEKMYSSFLLENDYKDSIFNEFLIGNFDEVCPVGGVIIYNNGKVICSLHKDDCKDDKDKSSGEEVPWL